MGKSTHVSPRLKKALNQFSAQYLGDPIARQPVHVVYGGAHLFSAQTPKKLAELAGRALRDYAPDAASLVRALELDIGLDRAEALYSKIRAKLEREAIEDFRIDFEDGFGYRSDEEEDTHAERAARELAAAWEKGDLPPFVGIRVKSFSSELHARASRTLRLFISTLLKSTSRKLPENFVVTLPKVVLAEQMAELDRQLAALETKHRLKRGAIRTEFMVETPQALIGSSLQDIVSASRGRCVAAHFGAYDYTAALNIAAGAQTLDHPACDYARQTMQVALAGTGVWLSDGATTKMPIGPHRSEAGGLLSVADREENRAVVHRAWRIAYRNIRSALRNGYYQGWDLHPAQVPVRYAAIYSFFMEDFDAASVRLKNFMGKAAQASLVGDMFDDAATGQGLLNFFLRAITCGAMDDTEVARLVEVTGLTETELRTRSFSQILSARRRQAR